MLSRLEEKRRNWWFFLSLSSRVFYRFSFDLRAKFMLFLKSKLSLREIPWELQFKFLWLKVFSCFFDRNVCVLDVEPPSSFCFVLFGAYIVWVATDLLSYLLLFKANPFLFPSFLLNEDIRLCAPFLLFLLFDLASILLEFLVFELGLLLSSPARLSMPSFHLMII